MTMTTMTQLINPRRKTVTVHRSLSEVSVLVETDELDSADVVPGWKVAIKDLFR